MQSSFKGFKLASNVEQQDYAEVQKEQSAQLSVKCRLGYAFMDLIHPPDVQLYFGRYNNRPLDQVRVKELAKGFREQGIAPWQDPIPIMAPRAWIDESSLEAQLVESRSGKMIAFTDAAKDQWIDVLGGHHRRAAYVEYVHSLRQDLDAAQKNVTKLHGDKKLDAKVKQEELEKWEKELANLRAKAQESTVWEVVVYAMGEWSLCARGRGRTGTLADREYACAEDVTDELGGYLSRNDETPHHRETDMEKFWRYLDVIRRLRTKEAPTVAIGSLEWTRFVAQRIPATIGQKGFGTLYNEPRSWDFINLVSKLVPLRPIFPIEVLRRRVRSVDGAHALSPGEKLGKRKGKSAETRAPDTAGGVSAHNRLVCVDGR